MSAPTRSWLPAYLGTGIVWGCSFLFIKLSLGFLTPFTASPSCAARWVRSRSSLLLRITGVAIAAGTDCLASSVGGRALSQHHPGDPLSSRRDAHDLDHRGHHQRADAAHDTVLHARGLSRRADAALPAGGARRRPLRRPRCARSLAGFGRNPWWAIAALLGAVTLYGASFPYSRRYLIPRGARARFARECPAHPCSGRRCCPPS